MILRVFLLLAGLFYFNLASAVSPRTDAPAGGIFVRNLSAEPSTIHPFSYSDAYAPIILSYIMESLAERDVDSYEFVPRLAEKWEGKGTRKVTFHLNKNAKFWDGSPVTAEDVKFSFEAIFDPVYGAATQRPYYENVSKIEVIDPLTIRFTFKNDYFQNFDAVAELTVVPKKVYGDKEKQKTLTKVAFGSGPYTVEKFERGQRIVLKKNKDWWGAAGVPRLKGYFNFDQLVFRFVTEEAVSLEMLKKGELDFEALSPEYYATKTKGPPFGKKVLKVEFENSQPMGYGFIGWNFKRGLFQDVKVRRALQELMNRDEMIKKFRYDNSVPAMGPEHFRSDYSSPNAKVIPFDVSGALKLLEEAGWKDSNQDGILDKMIDGKRVDFRFTLIYAAKDFEKYLTFYQEELKKSGIDMQLKFQEWNSFTRSLDEKSFDAVALAWSATPDWDPKQIWHSKSAEKGGSNFISYSNPKVDKLIDQARVESEKSKRMKMLHTVYDLIVEDCPYLWLFNEKKQHYGYASKLGRPADSFKYAVGQETWWMKASGE